METAAYRIAPAMAQRNLGRTITALDNAVEDVNGLFTWAELDATQRQEITQAHNAIELARACLRFIGPGKPFKIGF